jgi:acyl-CoA thioester hydrolase
MRKPGSLHASIRATVPFHDIDVATVVWHGHYLKYFENARWALMERLGFGLEAMLGCGYGWPVVELHVKYVKAARYGDELNVRASLAEWENRVVINYLVTDAATGERVARGQTTQVAVESASGALQFATPDILLHKVRTALEATDARASHG